jgi:hypothetical protein
MRDRGSQISGVGATSGRSWPQARSESEGRDAAKPTGLPKLARPVLEPETALESPPSESRSVPGGTQRAGPSS